MAKIGEKAVIISAGAKLTQSGSELLVSGPLGEIKFIISKDVEVVISDNQVKVVRKAEEKDVFAIQGTTVRLIQNAITGVVTGFSKTLEVVGTGYRAVIEGNDLVLSLGFSHQIKFSIPKGIKIETVENKIKIIGANKEQIGDIAYKIRELKKPDSYKGKGIRYLGEKLRLKPGKAAAKTGGAVAK